MKLIFSVLTAIFAVLTTANSTNPEKIRSMAKYSEFQPVIDRLIADSVSVEFIEKLLLSSNVNFDEKYIRINVVKTGGPPDYSKHYNRRAQTKASRFLSENRNLLEEIEAEFSVPIEFIVAILWVETRFGGYLGYHNVASVFLSAAMANEKEFVRRNKLSFLKKFKGSNTEKEAYLKKIESRSKSKADWAYGEVLSLAKIHDSTIIDVTSLEGSWAGAFGMSQFLPTSYVNWAVDGNSDKHIDLFLLEDAAHSVANYLKTNGWGNSLKQQRAAVWHYNHSDAYVNAVFRLAESIRSEEKKEKDNESTGKPMNLKTPLMKQIEKL